MCGAVADLLLLKAKGDAEADAVGIREGDIDVGFGERRRDIAALSVFFILSTDEFRGFFEVCFGPFSPFLGRVSEAIFSGCVVIPRGSGGRPGCTLLLVVDATTSVAAADCMHSEPEL